MPRRLIFCRVYLPPCGGKSLLFARARCGEQAVRALIERLGGDGYLHYAVADIYGMQPETVVRLGDIEAVAENLDRKSVV